MTIDDLIKTLTKAKGELGGETEVVISMIPGGTAQGHIDRIHPTYSTLSRASKTSPKMVVALYSLHARKYRLKAS